MPTSRAYESKLAELVKAVVPTIQVTLGETDDAVDKTSTINVYLTDGTLHTTGIADIFDCSIVTTMRVHRADIKVKDLDDYRTVIHGVMTDPFLFQHIGAVFATLESFAKTIEEDYWQIVWSVKAICEISEVEPTAETGD